MLKPMLVKIKKRIWRLDSKNGYHYQHGVYKLAFLDTKYNEYHAFDDNGNLLLFLENDLYANKKRIR